MQMNAGSRLSRTKLLFVINVVIIVGLVIGVGLFYKKYTDLKQNPNKLAEQETKELVQRVSSVFQGLPTDEQPTIATVQDKEKLQDQPFFANAVNGDKLLIYANARQAIIYREDTNKIINVGPIAIDNQNQAGATIKVTGDNIDDKIKLLTDASIATDGTKDTNKGNYAKPVIYLVDTAQESIANNIAGLLGGEVVKTLPAGEDAVTGVAIVVYAN